MSLLIITEGEYRGEEERESWDLISEISPHVISRYAFESKKRDEINKTIIYFPHIAICIALAGR